jgi:multiple sugar transport system ATP-binding protein
MSKVTLKNVYKIYEGGVRAVSDFNLEIKDKEFIVFVGPSGCGKSTTLRMIAGLENITSGKLYIDDALVNDVDSKDRDIAMVFQSYALYPHMTVFQNMAFGLKLRKEDPKEIEERVKKAAEILEITDLLTRKPKALSGGQRQRVALGRAIVREPKVFLLDEPLSNLDAKLRVAMRTEITKLHKRLATTFIYVTHDQTEAMTMGDRIVVMKQGVIQQVDTPVNLYENPCNLFVATFLGSPQMNIINCLLKDENGTLKAYLNSKDELGVTFPELKAKQLSDNSYLNKEVSLGIRPEHIKISNKGIPATIDVVEQLGDETIVYASIEGQNENIVIKENYRRDFASKERVFLEFNMEEAHLFSKENESSILGVPLENNFFVDLSKSGVSCGKWSFEFPENYKKHILETAFESKKVHFSFSPAKVLFEPCEDSLAFEGEVDFMVRKTDKTSIFLSVKGLPKYVVFSVTNPCKIKEKDKMKVYVRYEDLVLKDESGVRLTSKEEIIPNEVKAFLKEEKDQTMVRFGPHAFYVPLIPGVNGYHIIKINEDKVKVVLNAKQRKVLNLPKEKVDAKRCLSVSAYDEEQLGEKNILFVEVKGINHYCTFVVPSSFSVYNAPKFKLYMEDGAITIVK